MVKFDPLTLNVLSTTFVGDSPNYLLHSAIRDGGVAVTGPEWGHNQEVAPGLWAGWTPSPMLLADVARGVPDTPSPYWQGNAQGARSPRRPTFTIFVEPSVLAQGPPQQTAAMYEEQVKFPSWSGAVHANPVFYREQNATVENFLGAVKRLTDAVAFIGHSVVVDGRLLRLEVQGQESRKKDEPGPSSRAWRDFSHGRSRSR